MPHPPPKVKGNIHARDVYSCRFASPPQLNGNDCDGDCVLSEAPRPLGQSESPVLPKKFGGADSPGISDLPDIITIPKGKPTAEAYLPPSLNGGFQQSQALA